MVTLACPRVGAEKTRLRPSIGGTRLPSQRMAAPSPRGEPAARFYPFADRAVSRQRRRHHRCPPQVIRAELPSRPAGPAAPAPGRVPWTRQTSADLSVRSRGPTLSAQQEIRCSEYSAASSVLAFWMRGPPERFVPRDGCRRELAGTRRVSTGFERRLISGVQRRRRPDRQACLAARRSLIDVHYRKV